MGIIARQSSKKTIVSFIGVLIGAISILFIYPYDKEIYGLALFLFSSANLLMIFLSAGSLGLIVKYFPVFEKRRIQGFLSFIFLVVGSTMVIASLLLLIAKPLLYQLLDWAAFDVEMIRKFSLPIYVLTVLLVFSYIFINHASNHRRIVVPSILFELTYKIALPILVLAAYLEWLNEEVFIRYYLGFFLLVVLGLLSYLLSLGALKVQKIERKKLSPPLKKEMASFMLFSALNNIGTTIVARVDTIMVATLISLNDTGIYGILLFMANVIDIPVRSINQIAGPVISSSMENMDRENVSRIYKKSSINSIVIGLFIFIFIWGLLPNIFQIMPDGEAMHAYKHVFLFLGLAKLIDMTFSTNTHILIYSRFYRYNLFFVLFLAVFNLVLNYFLIREYGMVGAALSSAISLAAYNVLKLFFIKINLQYWPFTLETLKMLCMAILLYLGVGFLPNVFNAWPDLFLKGFLIVSIYYLLLKLFRIRADIIVQAEDLLLRMFAFFRNGKQ
jgi:O-antigen/teichoic acid export membrane protein